MKSLYIMFKYKQLPISLKKQLIQYSLQHNILANGCNQLGSYYVCQYKGKKEDLKKFLRKIKGKYSYLLEDTLTEKRPYEFELTIIPKNVPFYPLLTQKHYERKIPTKSSLHVFQSLPSTPKGKYIPFYIMTKNESNYPSKNASYVLVQTEKNSLLLKTLSKRDLNAFTIWMMRFIKLYTLYK